MKKGFEEKKLETMEKNTLLDDLNLDLR